MAMKHRAGICLVAARGIEPAWDVTIAQTARAILARLGEGASVWAGVRDEEATADFTSELQAANYPVNSEYPDAIPDATIQITIAAGAAPEQLSEVVQFAIASLNGDMVLARCAAVLGEVYHLRAGEDERAIAYIGRRDQAKTRADFVAWWKSHHAPLNLDSSWAAHVTGYELIVALEPLSREACIATAIDPGYDLFETVFTNDWQRMLAAAAADVATYSEDEKGSFVAESLRGSIVRRVFGGE